MADDWNTDRPGRIPVLIAAIGIFSMSILGLLIDPDTPSIIRLLLSGAIAIAVYHRHNWARWLILVLVVLAVLFVAYLILTTPMPRPLIYVFLAASLVYVAIVALLFVPSWGGKYFEPDPMEPRQGGML